MKTSTLLPRKLEKIVVIHLKNVVRALHNLNRMRLKVNVPKGHVSIVGGVRPPSPPRHDTTAPEEPTPARVQPPRQAKTKDAEFHYTK